MLSPALLVWMIRTFFVVPSPAALRLSVPRKIAASRATHRRIVCLLIMIVSLSVGAARLPHHPVAERLPLGIVLRGEVLPAVVKEVASRVLGERMHEQLALHAARHHRHAPHGIEILARLFVGPRRGARIERLQAHWRALAVARDAARMPRSLLQEDRLDLRLEVLVVQPCPRGRGRLLPQRCDRQKGPAAEGDNDDASIHGALLRRSADYLLFRRSFKRRPGEQLFALPGAHADGVYQ